METSHCGSQCLSLVARGHCVLFPRALRFCDSQESHSLSGVWILRRVGLADNLRGETCVHFIKGEVPRGSFPVYRSATGCLPALFPWGRGVGGLAHSTDTGLYFFNKTRDSLFLTVPSDRANRKGKEKKKQK